MSHATVCTLLSCLLMVPLAAQGKPPAPAPTPAPQPAATAQQPEPPKFDVLVYPRDKDRVLARVGDRELTLEQLVKHIEDRHYPGFRTLLADPSGQRLLSSDLIAAWVRQFADIQLLQLEVAARKLDPATADPVLAESLKRSFEFYLEQYSAGLKQQGNDTNLSQPRVNRLLADYQMRHGLGCELQGWLDFLEKDDYPVGLLRDWFNDHPRYFGGMVTFQQILVQNRDPGTGIRLNDEGQKRAIARLTDIKARLAANGSNFAEVARLMSDDTRTAKKGGEFANVHRFDDRLPAVLCRTAWSLDDGQISDIVESQYGFHIIRRVEFNQKTYVMWNDAAVPSIREVMRRHRQEDLLFSLRAQHKVQLQY